GAWAAPAPPPAGGGGPPPGGRAGAGGGGAGGGATPAGGVAQGVPSRRMPPPSRTGSDYHAPGGGPNYQPQDSPLFCSLSHFWRGAKYSSSADASAARSPVMASMASGQGRLAPIDSMALSFAPAAGLP